MIIQNSNDQPHLQEKVDKDCIPESNHELDQIREYEAKGYTGSYQMDEGQLKDLNTSVKYPAQEVKIEAQFRYEGMTNPSDESIMYVLKMSDGAKGIILRPYGAVGKDPVDEFLQSVVLKDPENPVH